MAHRVGRRSLLMGAAGVVAAPLVGAWSSARAAAAPSAGASVAPLVGASATALGQVSREPFTIIMLPDTHGAQPAHPAYFNAQTQWISNNRNTMNIRYVVHVGDLVREGYYPDDWVRARNAMSKLDGRVPSTISIGNHDYDDWPARKLTTTQFHKYFPYSKASALPTFANAYPANTLNNHWHRFTAGGTDWAILTLRYNPSDEDLAWGARQVAAHPELTWIINTHAYLTTGGRTAIGDRIWNAITGRYPNVVMTLNGHYARHHEYQVSTGTNGNRVFEIMADYQNTTNLAENGYLLILAFDPATGTVSVKTYSPHANAYKTGPKQQFVLTGVPMPEGAPRVRRHIINTDVRALWGFDSSDHWYLPPDELTKYPLGPAITTGPRLIRGTGEVPIYLYENGYKRHIVNQRSRVAWGLQSVPVEYLSPAAVAAIPTGPAWPDYPYLMRSPGTAPIYLLDAPIPAPA